MQEGEDDEDINTIDTSTPTQVQVTGPVTRAHARQLNYQVRSLLGLCPTYLDHGNTCTLVLLRNDGEDPKGKGFTQARFWTAGHHQLVTVTTTTYGLQFGRFSTFQKAYQVHFQTDPTSCLYLIEVGRNH